MSKKFEEEQGTGNERDEKEVMIKIQRIKAEGRRRGQEELKMENRPEIIVWNRREK